MAPRHVRLSIAKMTLPTFPASLCREQLLRPDNSQAKCVAVTPDPLAPLTWRCHTGSGSVGASRRHLESDHFSAPAHAPAPPRRGLPEHMGCCPLLHPARPSCMQQPAGRAPCSAQAHCGSISPRLKFKVLMKAMRPYARHGEVRTSSIPEHRHHCQAALPAHSLS